ncbi:phosphatase PAP2 family protein [Thermococcus sp. 21S9]|uniref:phosphatase PAP2 family protein n=1 Tax=Thermococcus sp. 21S9 TaxID=1638223 RepID=UPI00143ACB80|nr:phosphatase PAP2 family protein [Thermococcus sp. 21S9]NJE54887.1 phosphatase PAP2 family protein [Thermococcus sp. 21S9]
MTGKRLRLILLFLVVYLSWDAYALVYPFIGRWSADVTRSLLQLPLTSYRFEYSLVSWTVSHRFLHAFMRAVYRAGFAGSFWLPALYLTFTDPERAKRLAFRFALGFGILALSFLILHVHAPHVVYDLPGRYAPNDWTARPEFVLPSPHCTLAFIGLLSVLEVKRKENIPLAVFLALVPISTVLLGEHWVWDAVAGFLVALVAVGLEKRV